MDQATNPMPNGVRFYRERLRQNKVKDWSQLAVAQHVGCPRSRISMIETGDVLPTMNEIERLAEYLEVTPGHLYTARQIELISEFDQLRRSTRGG